MLSREFWQQEVGTKLLRLRFVSNLFVISLTMDLFKYWDLRTANPIATVQLPERCYTFDIQYPLLVVGTAERHIQIYNLTNPSTAYKV